MREPGPRQLVRPVGDPEVAPDARLGVAHRGAQVAPHRRLGPGVEVRLRGVRVQTLLEEGRIYKDVCSKKLDRGYVRPRYSYSGLGFMAVVDFATSDFETCPKYQNWANFINKSTTES